MPPNSDHTPPASLGVEARVVGYAGEVARLVTRETPVETPVNIVYAPVPFAVMMATPRDLEDFAVGFSLTEGIIDAKSDIRSVAIEPVDNGLRAIVTLSSDKMQRHLARARNIAGRTGCGVCGIDDLKSLPQAGKREGRDISLGMAAIERALNELESAQPLNDLTRAVHAAAWCGLNGGLIAVREDVGRHNALDKLIGALVRGDHDPTGGFVLITSRCSFEMVEKAAVFGARAVVAISAPTSLAIERAQLHDMTLVAIARRDNAMIFSGERRVLKSAPMAFEKASAPHI